MPLPHDRTIRRCAVLALLLLASAMLAVALPRHASAPPQPTREEIAHALDEVKADPLLTAERTIKTLRWNDTQRRETRTPPWLEWLGGLFRWLDQSARVLIWMGAAVLIGMLVVFLLRMIHAAHAEGVGAAFVAPTHVRDLDIRPETLPEEIGRAARELWDRGDHRAALALLYRGLLSRLAHVHHLPIRESTTEGDCLMLAATHLTDERRDYTARLVRVWQRAVYGGEPSATSVIYGLCDGFAAALNAPPALDTRGSGHSAAGAAP